MKINENPEISRKNKCTAEDMNEIKNAINQECCYTATNYSNKKFTCNLVGNLKSGDTIQLILDLTSQSDVDDNDISISINGGVNDYNLMDKTGTYVLKASDFGYNKIYVKAIYDSSKFILLSPEINKSSITIKGDSSQQNMSTSSSYADIALGDVLSKSGNRLKKERVMTIDGDYTEAVKIGNGVTKVKASATVQFNNNNNTSTMYFVTYIYKIDSSSSGEAVARAITPSITASSSDTATIAPILIDVKEGDSLYLRGYKSMASGTGSIGQEERTLFTVEVVE